MAKKTQKAIQALLQGLCALIFLLPGVPEGLSRCLGSLLMATPQPTRWEIHMWAYQSSRWRQETEPASSSSKEKGTGCGGSSNSSDSKNQTQTLGTT